MWEIEKKKQQLCESETQNKMQHNTLYILQEWETGGTNKRTKTQIAYKIVRMVGREVNSKGPGCAILNRQ